MAELTKKVMYRRPSKIKIDKNRLRLFPLVENSKNKDKS